MKHLSVLFFVMMCSFCTVAHADPRRWGEHGVVVRNSHEIVYSVSNSAQNSAGQTLVLWSDVHAGGRDIYAQLVDETGNPLWTPDGVAVVSGARTQDSPFAVAVEGGWIVAWVDFRRDTLCGEEGDPPCGDVYAQKLDDAGNLLWPENDGAGVAVDVSDDGVNWVRLVDDGNGGAIVVWWQYSELSQAVFGQHLDASGLLTWPMSRNLIVGETHLLAAQTASDMSGNLLLAWSAYTTWSLRRLSVSKISPDGNLLWGANGVLACDSLGSQQTSSVCADGSGGCYIGWTQAGANYATNLFAQHISSEADTDWTANGLPLCTAERDRAALRLATSYVAGEPDGLLAVWQDRRVTYDVSEIFAQKMSLDGQPVWQTDGVRVCGDATPEGGGHERNSPRVVSDQAGGLVSVWDDFRSGTYSFERNDLYASRIGADGIDLWGVDGVPVANSDIVESYASIFLSSGSCMIPYFTMYSLNGESVRVQRLNLTDGAQTIPGGTVLISGYSGFAVDVHVIEMSQGRTGIVWRDGRLSVGGNALFYQILLPGGEPELAQNGEILALSDSGVSGYNQDEPRLCTDGDGGFFVSFSDWRMETAMIRVSHVNSSGGVVDSDSGAVVWYEPGVTQDQHCAFLTPDGQGGVYVAWSGYSPNYHVDPYVMRLNSHLQRMWAEPICLRATDPDDIMTGIVSSSNGSCIVAWQSGDYSSFDVSTARILPDGSVAWNFDVCSALNDQDNCEIRADGQGGAYYAWSDQRNEPANRDIYAQHVNANGTVSWAANGIPLIVFDQNQNRPLLTVLSDGEVGIVWEDFRSGETLKLYGQRLNPEGERLWDTTGVLLGGTNGNCVLGRTLADDHGGMFITWSAGPVHRSNIFAAHIDSAGNSANDPFWTPVSGTRISEEDVSGSGPTLASDGAGGCVVAWMTAPESEGQSYGSPIQAQRLNDVLERTSPSTDNSVPTEFALYQNYPNPFNPSTTIRFDVPRAGIVNLVLYDLLGRRVMTMLDSRLAAGHHQIALDVSALPTGLYVYRLSSGSFSQSRKLIVLK